MELTLEEIELPLAQQFEDDISDDLMVINVKLNFEVDLEEDIKYSLRENVPLMDIRNYVIDLGCEIMFSTIGFHLNGENKQPHIHYHFITTAFKQPSNPSQHRKRWLNKQNNPHPAFVNCSFKFQQIDKKKPKYSVLSYPLKEGTPVLHYKEKTFIYNKLPMTKEQINFLVETGKAIYDKELGLKLRQDKCQERKKQSLTDLHDILKDHSNEFSTYLEMVRWLDKNYISTLSLEEYPDPKNYKTNCQKIAISLGKLKYSDIL